MLMHIHNDKTDGIELTDIAMKFIEWRGKKLNISIKIN